MSKYLVHLAVATSVFVIILAFARNTPSTVAAPLIDWYEECEQEGCDDHEVEELYDSFHHECNVEGCSSEEVRELAGATSRIDNMYTAFCNLGKNFTWLHSNVARMNCPQLRTQQLQVLRHTSVALTNAQTDTIFQTGTTRLQTNDGGGDVGCNVRLVRNGNVMAFANNGTIFNQADFDAVIGLAGNGKVVNAINWCSGTGSFNGCAPRPGTSFVVRRGAPDISWTHEYGHNKGLPHRSTNALNIMNGSGSATRNRVNAVECTAFRD